MVYFPLEIVSHIVDGLRELQQATDSWTPYACISRQWQQAIEPLIWQKIEFQFDELSTFRDYCAKGKRRQLLKTVRVTLSGYFENTFDESESHESGDESDSAESEALSETADNEEDEEKDVWEVLDDRVSKFKSDHQRFFKEIMAVWDELHSWESNLKVTSIEVHVEGECAYELLGPMMRWGSMVSKYLVDDRWLVYLHQPLPTLQTVTSFVVSANKEIDLWPAIVGCDVAASLPNLQELRLKSADWQKRWEIVRMELRNILARKLTELPHSQLHNVELLLPFRYCINHEGDPRSLLDEGRDRLSNSLNVLSQNLTTLSLNVNQISPALFWNPLTPFPPEGDLAYPTWPHLAHIHIDTGFETASRDFNMRSTDSFLSHRHLYREMDLEDMSFEDSEEELEISLGDYPTIIFRVRPEPEYFDTLAISIARAAACMPALQSITLEMISYRTDQRMYTGYHGWGFAFRAGPEARYPVAHTRAWTGYPGIDLWELNGPRCEWVFRCEERQIEWEEPAEARELWQQRFPGVEIGIVAFEEFDDGDNWWSEKFGFYLTSEDMEDSTEHDSGRDSE